MLNVSQSVIGLAAAVLLPAFASAEAPKGGETPTYAVPGAHVPQTNGWKITPTHFAKQGLADVWLDQ